MSLARIKALAISAMTLCSLAGISAAYLAINRWPNLSLWFWLDNLMVAVNAGAIVMNVRTWRTVRRLEGR